MYLIKNYPTRGLIGNIFRVFKTWFSLQSSRLHQANYISLERGFNSHIKIHKLSKLRVSVFKLIILELNLKPFNLLSNFSNPHFIFWLQNRYIPAKVLGLIFSYSCHLSRSNMDLLSENIFRKFCAIVFSSKPQKLKPK